MKKKFFITTAIDYVNNLPHIGTAYEKIGADVVARFKRLDGFQVHFLMGNDEHSANVKKEAEAQKMDPGRYCDQMAKEFQAIWKKLNISYDDFIRTSEPRHFQAVRELFQKIYDRGDIYQDCYRGWYCESCEAFYKDKDLAEGQCPVHHQEPKWIEEENYFFALSRYQERLLGLIEDNPRFISPEIRRNEILNLIKGGLEDVSISRSSFDWGIPLPVKDGQVAYVWFDALINYISAVGYGQDEEIFRQHWPADLHVIGKDITRFHCVIWPAMLMAAGLEVPRMVFGHGFVYLKGEKMSKTLGNVVEPLQVVDRFGADPLRYYLLREGSFGRDGKFVWENFIDRYNNDLANDLGNLLNRTLNMIRSYQAGTFLAPGKEGEPEGKLRSTALSAREEIRKCLDESEGDINFHEALVRIWEVIREANRYLDRRAPWKLKKEGKEKEVSTVLYFTAELLRIVSLLLSPFMPGTGREIWRQLGLEEAMPFTGQDFTSVKDWGGLPVGTKICPGSPLFPRIKQEEEVSSLEDSKTEKKSEQLIGFEEFQRLDLMVGEVIEAERVKGSNKLIKLKINIGEERTVVAGIGKVYRPEDLVGKKVVFVANLEPAKLMGIESQGMILAAGEESNLVLICPEGEVAVGAKVS